MDIPYLINLLQNKFNYLNNARSAAVAIGDLNGVTSIEQEILTTQNTIAQLQLLQSITQAATTNDSTVKEILNAGVEVVQNMPNIPDNPVEIIGEYDITDYATDPLYKQKIEDILSVMGQMLTATEISDYINNEAIGSPLNGDMILEAVQKYDIDVRLLLAILELESRFGTAGVAVGTLNPGNVGNTDDGSTKTFSSWSEGVMAVAKWLDNHRIVISEESVAPVDSTEETADDTSPTNKDESSESEESIPTLENVDQAVPTEPTPSVTDTNTNIDNSSTEIPTTTNADQTVSLKQKRRRVV